MPPLFDYQQKPAAAKFGVRVIDPPVAGFYAKLLDFESIPIRASAGVEDRALVIARNRIARLFMNMGAYRSAILTRLSRSGVEFHVIGRTEAVTDLPENLTHKGERMEDFGGLTLDDRTRGTGGRYASCGEENLLLLASDRYLGKDICTHEFAHCLLTFGVPQIVRDRFVRQFEASSHIWRGEYAGTNPDEFFAELTGMYFGRGREVLKQYDPDAYALFDDFYSGRFAAGDF